MRQAPRDHVPVTPDLSGRHSTCRAFAFWLAGSWLIFALAAAFFAFGV